jgi:hypothetical protein
MLQLKYFLLVLKLLCAFGNIQLSWKYTALIFIGNIELLNLWKSLQSMSVQYNMSSHDN